MGITDSIKDFFEPQPENTAADDRRTPRFELIEQQGIGVRTLYVIRDTETGVCYLTGTGNDCPLTPLLDAEGNPIVMYD